MNKWLILILLLLAPLAWAGEHANESFSCDDPKTHDKSWLCFHDDTHKVLAYCDAPTYGTMPRVYCWDREAKEITTFGLFAKANPLNDKTKPDDWLCADDHNLRFYRCEQPESGNKHLEGGNWMCLDLSDGQIKKCSTITSGHWSIIELPSTGD